MNTKTKNQVVSTDPVAEQVVATDKVAEQVGANDPVVEQVIAEVLTPEQNESIKTAGETFANSTIDKQTAINDVSAVMQGIDGKDKKTGKALGNYAHSHHTRVEELVSSAITSARPELNAKTVTQYQSRLIGDALKLAEIPREQIKSQTVIAKKRDATREARAKKVTNLAKIGLKEISEKIATVNNAIINASNKVEATKAKAELDLLFDARTECIAPEITAKLKLNSVAKTEIRDWLNDKLKGKSLPSVADQIKLLKIICIIKDVDFNEEETISEE